MSKVLLYGSVLLVAACGTDSAGPDPVDPGPTTLSAAIAANDTTAWRGDTIVLTATAQYEPSGIGLPISVVWATSDTGILGVASQAEGAVRVTARAVGSALLTARINEFFFDTIAVGVVDNGSVMWRRTVGSGGLGIDLAVDVAGNVYAADGMGNVTALAATGDTLWVAPGCPTSTGPAVSGDAVYAWGTSCARRMTAAGASIWSDSLGGFDTRQAVLSDGSLIVLTPRLAVHDSNLTVTRYGPTGTIVWQDTLQSGADFGGLRGGIGVSNADDIYVAWYAPWPDSNFVTRYESGGQRRWSARLPGAARQTAPAVVGGRVYVTHTTGISVRDTAGGVVYDLAWQDILDGWPANDGYPPEPVLDPVGNLYLQKGTGLISLDPAGAVRWIADSIRGGFYSSGPVVLEDGSLVTMCGVAVCGVDAASGAVRWRGPDLENPPPFVGGPAVGPDGTLYLKWTGEVVALWHRGLMATTGWPTLGGNRGRTGTAP